MHENSTDISHSLIAYMPKINERQKTIIEILTQNPQGLGFNQLVSLTKINRPTLSKTMKELVTKGDVLKWTFPEKSLYVLYDHREYLHCYCAYIDMLFDELEKFSKDHKGRKRNAMAVATLSEVSKIWGRVMNEFLCHSGGWNNYNVLHKRIGLRLQDWLKKYGFERSKSEKIDQFRLGAKFFEAFNFEKFCNIKTKEFRTHPY